MSIVFNNLPYEIEEHILLFTDLETCINVGNWYCAKKIYKNNKRKYNPNVLTNIIVGHLENNNTEAVIWMMHNKMYGYKTHLFDMACYYGNILIVALLHYNNFDCSIYSIMFSAKNGHLQLLKMLRYWYPYKLSSIEWETYEEKCKSVLNNNGNMFQRLKSLIF